MEWKWTSAVVSLAFVVATLYNQIAGKVHVVADFCVIYMFLFWPSPYSPSNSMLLVLFCSFLYIISDTFIKQMKRRRRIHQHHDSSSLVLIPWSSCKFAPSTLKSFYLEHSEKRKEICVAAFLIIFFLFKLQLLIMEV